MPGRVTGNGYGKRYPCAIPHIGGQDSALTIEKGPLRAPRSSRLRLVGGTLVAGRGRIALNRGHQKVARLGFTAARCTWRFYHRPQ